MLKLGLAIESATKEKLRSKFVLFWHWLYFLLLFSILGRKTFTGLFQNKMWWCMNALLDMVNTQLTPLLTMACWSYMALLAAAI